MKKRVVFLAGFIALTSLSVYADDKSNSLLGSVEIGAIDFSSLPPVLAATAKEESQNRDTKLIAKRADGICRQGGFDRAFSYKVIDGKDVSKILYDFQNGNQIIIENSEAVATHYHHFFDFHHQHDNDGIDFGEQFTSIDCLRDASKAGENLVGQIGISPSVVKSLRSLGLIDGAKFIEQTVDSNAKCNGVVIGL